MNDWAIGHPFVFEQTHRHLGVHVFRIYKCCTGASKPLFKQNLGISKHSATFPNMFHLAENMDNRVSGLMGGPVHCLTITKNATCHTLCTHILIGTSLVDHHVHLLADRNAFILMNCRASKIFNFMCSLFKPSYRRRMKH